MGKCDRPSRLRGREDVGSPFSAVKENVRNEDDWIERPIDEEIASCTKLEECCERDDGQRNRAQLPGGEDRFACGPLRCHVDLPG